MGRQSGFAYLFMLFVIALLTISILAISTLGYYTGVRSDEAELLRIGAEFRRAIVSYRDAAAPRVYPVSLDELLSDRRNGIEKRHLRKIYIDPVTRSREWGVVIVAGRVVGVHSLSSRVPMKTSGFDPADRAFEGAQHYSDWVFQPAGAAVEAGEQ